MSPIKLYQHMVFVCVHTIAITIIITSGQSNLTTVQWYSSGGASVHPHLTHASLGPPEFKAKLQLDPFNRSFARITAECCYTLQQAAHFPPKNCPFPWGIWTPSNMWFPEPIRACNPNGIWIGSAIFAGSRL